MFAQVIYGTRPVVLIALGVGVGATLIAMLIGVAAAYLGGLWDGGLNLLTDVLLVIPLFPLLIVIARLPERGRHRGDDRGDHRDRLVLHRAAAPGPGAVAAQPGLPGGGPGPRRAAAVHHRGRDHPDDDLAAGGQLPDQRAVRGAVLLQPAVHRPRQPQRRPAGARCSTGPRTRRRSRPGRRCGSSFPACASSPLGAAFALLNYAFDEIGNPALRPVRSIRGKRVKRA